MHCRACLLLILFLVGMCDSQEALHRRKTFFVGGNYVLDENSQHVLQGQMYVEHLIPDAKDLQPYPIVFIHGATRTGSDWLTKPGGTPGWASYFLDRGFECYLIDQPYQGRSPTVPTKQTLRHFSAEQVEQRFTATRDFDLWSQAALHSQWPGSGWRGDPVFDQVFASGNYLVNNATLQQTSARDAMVALLERIGKPVILLGHSQGGAVLWLTADAKQEVVKGIVAIEPLGPPFRNEIPNSGPARAYGLTDIPITYDPPVTDPEKDLKKVEVDAPEAELADCLLQAEPARQLVHLTGLPVLVVTGQASYHARYDWCTTRYLKQAGVDATHLPLEERNITGNGHLMYAEKNSDCIADEIAVWLTEQKLTIDR